MSKVLSPDDVAAAFIDAYGPYSLQSVVVREALMDLIRREREEAAARERLACADKFAAEQRAADSIRLASEQHADDMR